MSFITDLPDDVLLDIIRCFERDKLSLCRLARTHPRFYPLASPYVFRYVDIEIAGPTNVIASRTYARLLRSTRKSPDLAASVRTIRVTGHLSVQSKSKSKLIVRKVNHLLRALRSIESLELDFTGRCDNVELSFLEDNCTPFLRYINLNYARVSFSTITKCLLLDKIESVRIREPSWLGCWPKSPPGSQSNKSPLLNLEILHYYTTQSILYEILQRSPAIQKVTIGSLLLTNPTPFSAKYVQDILEPAKHSLLELRLKHRPGIPLAHNDNSGMDLSGFSSMRVLQIPNRCLFPTGKPDPSQSRTYTLLPHTLEELTVSWILYRLDM